MDLLRGILHNRILIAAVLAWTAAQVIKAVLYGLIHHHFDWRRLLGDGGMPSTHSATVTAAATACGLMNGLDSAIFALAVL